MATRSRTAGLTTGQREARFPMPTKEGTAASLMISMQIWPPHTPPGFVGRQAAGHRQKIYVIDSTAIGLFQPIFECVGRYPNNGKRKGGIKSLQKLDMQAVIPVKVYHSNAREHDSLFIQIGEIMKKREVALFDKACNTYALFDIWNKEGVFFVIRLKDNAKETLLEESDLVEATPDNILRDAKTALRYNDDKGREKQAELRLMSFYHEEKNRDYYFLTNLFDLPAEQIATHYKKCWEIELLFKK